MTYLFAFIKVRQVELDEGLPQQPSGEIGAQQVLLPSDLRWERVGHMSMTFML